LSQLVRKLQSLEGLQGSPITNRNGDGEERRQRRENENE
jgi:hypothetical protein